MRARARRVRAGCAGCQRRRGAGWWPRGPLDPRASCAERRRVGAWASSRARAGDASVGTERTATAGRRAAGRSVRTARRNAEDWPEMQWPWREMESSFASRIASCCAQWTGDGIDERVHCGVRRTDGEVDGEVQRRRCIYGLGSAGRSAIRECIVGTAHELPVTVLTLIFRGSVTSLSLSLSLMKAPKSAGTE